MKTDMSAFSYGSMASIGSLIYVGIVLIVELPKYYKANSKDAKGNIAPVYWDMNLFTGFSMNFFAF